VVPLGAFATASLLSACGGGGSDDSASASTATVVPQVILSLTGYTYARATSDQEAARFLLQTQFSASEAQIAAVRASGYVPWLEAQLSAPKGGTGWDWLNSKGYGDALNPANYFDSSSPGDYMVWNQLITGPDAVRKRAALALSEFFVVSLSGLDFSWRSHAAAHYWDTLCTHALGNYRDLLEAITLNVAMGYYLNTKGNKGENSAGRQPDENYAREVMQLFTIGVQMLNPDGSVQLDGAGKPIDSYTATDVSNLARVFTGYDLDQSKNVPTRIPQTGGGTRTVSNTAFARLPMAFSQNNHSTSNVSFLNVNIAGSANASVALETALDTLFNHSNTAPFFCKQMIQRLVTSNPSPAYVARVAAVFDNNGFGVRGALAHVFAAIVLDDEARGPAGLTHPEFGKLREPMVRMVQWARSFGVTSATGAWKIGDLSNPGSQLGQSPLRSPSVFNFFRPGYVPPSTALTAGRVAPEFQLVTESSVGGYLNYMQNVINTGINSSDIKASYTAELKLVTDAAALVRHLNTVLCAGQLSGASQTLIATALNTPAVTSASSATLKRNRICAAVLLVMASAEYLIQK
jgi:uncharacterized protein (DUF1800 family)